MTASRTLDEGADPAHLPVYERLLVREAFGVGEALLGAGGEGFLSPIEMDAANGDR